MTILPGCILVLLCKYSTKKNTVVEILMEYFNNTPHIKYTNYDFDSKDTCYILPYNKTTRNIVEHIGKMIYTPTWDSVGYMVYELECCTSLYDVYTRTHYKPFHNGSYFPYRIEIDHKIEDTLIAITEG